MTHITSTDIHGNKYRVAHSELTWRPSAYGIIVHDGQILLTEQYQKFILPGGGIDFGETPEQAVIREVKEETGFDIKNPKLVEVQSDFFSYQDDGQAQMCHLQTLLMFFLCEFAGGEASINGFTQEEQLVGGMPQWFKLADLHKINAGASFDWRAVVKRAL